MDAHTKRNLRVSFCHRDAPPPVPSVTPLPHNLDDEGSPLPNADVSSSHGEAPVILIDEKKINDFRRFRLLFVALLLMINCSTSGVYALYGLYIEAKNVFDVRDMVNILAAGTAFGLFVFPFGVMFDFLGPKPVILCATILTAVGHLLLGLTFGGHIEGTKTRYCIYFALLSWGCCTYDIAVVPVIASLMPRDRAQPISIVKTFSGLGAPVIACLFRGFFDNHYDYLMYAIVAFVFVSGLFGVWYFENAPYEVTRLEECRLKIKDRLHVHFIRNRYMSQLLPKQRLHILALIMVILNIYLTIQVIYVGYNRDSMTLKDFRGLAVGAIIIVLMITFLLIPLKCLDGKTRNDNEVVELSEQKEKELDERRKERTVANQFSKETEKSKPPFHNVPENSFEPIESVSKNNAEESKNAKSKPRKDEDDEDNNSLDGHEQLAGIGKRLPYEKEPVEPNASVVMVPNSWFEEGNVDDNIDTDRKSNKSIIRTTALADRSSRNNNEALEVLMRDQSTYNHPHVETITVCGEVFVIPVYETTFLESLTYMDLWLIFYTTFVVWGIGLTLTANWNIRTMVKSRYDELQMDTYVLISAISGVCLAGGRVVIGIYDELLPRFNQRFGFSIPTTVAYPLPSILLALSIIFYLSLPGNLSLIIVYVIGPFAFGISSSMTFYVITVIFKRDIGMHYGFCVSGAALGVALLYRVLFFEVYNNHRLILPPSIPINTRGICKGFECMETTLIVYLVLIVTSIGSSLIVHYRYWKLVHGKLKYLRVTARIRDHLRRRKLEGQKSRHENGDNINNNNKNCV